MKEIKKFLQRFVSLLIVLIILLLTGWFSNDVSRKETGRTPEKNQKSKSTLNITAPSVKILEQLNLDTATTLVQTETGVWQLKDESIILSTLAFSSEIKGYGGHIPMYIHIDNKRVISQIAISNNRETPSYLKRVINANFLENWIGKNINGIEHIKYDVISGATATTKAIAQEMEQTILMYQNLKYENKYEPVIGWAKTVAVFAIIIITLLFIFLRIRNKKLRIFLQIINIIVIGFWTGQFISMSLIVNWFKSGVLLVFLPMLLIVVLAFLLPLIGKKEFYCFWICPYGATQEIIGKCNRRKWRISQLILNILKYLRNIILIAVLVTIWFQAGSSLIDYEPFSAFLFSNASPAVIVIALIFIALSLFIDRPWCRFFCPTGTLLKWSYSIITLTKKYLTTRAHVVCKRTKNNENHIQ